ncbi:glutamate receptor ionotropic, NMDA 1-like [Dendronephthya gigantea]|uniref:glutamate receptor ionotropic, NMDA 1-like n=1 Tax=Dendronephthya gigantea TaxID=151771 RepID=UPI0010696BD4|nr:glutamate receptor ionotropic, NMDA 1-like [Dendronephthya gigantea]
MFNQWRLEGKKYETPVLRVVTRLKPPYLMFGSVQDRKSTGECEQGRICRQFTGIPENLTTGVVTAPIPSTNTLNDESVTTTSEYKCCTGLIIEFLERLESDVGFDSKIHLVKDGKWGSNDPKTQQWNGMIGELVRNEADLAASTLTITAKRSKVVDFSYPYVDVANGILVSTQPVSHDVWDFAFLDTFSGHLWLALFVTIQIVIGILWLAERLRKRRRFQNFPHKRDNSISCAQIINYTWSLMFQKASEEVGPTTLGGRTVAALFAFCSIVACSSFTANLAAIKVTTKDGISISGIRDQKFQTGEIKVGTIANSANLDFFRDSTDPSLQRIYKRIKGNVVSSYEAAAKKILSREWTAFVADTPQLEHMVSKETDCALKITGDPFFFSGYGIALRKNSTWNTRLSIVITSLVREGYISGLQVKWLGTGCSNTKQPNTEKMGTNDIGGAFLIVSFGCVASGVFLLLEYAVWYALVRKDMAQTRAGEKKKNVDHAFGALVKVLTLWEVTSSTNNQLNQIPTTEATLRTFKTIDFEKETSRNKPTEDEH